MEPGQCAKLGGEEQGRHRTEKRESRLSHRLVGLVASTCEMKELNEMVTKAPLTRGPLASSLPGGAMCLQVAVPSSGPHALGRQFLDRQHAKGLWAPALL